MQAAVGGSCGVATAVLGVGLTQAASAGGATSAAVPLGGTTVFANAGTVMAQSLGSLPHTGASDISTMIALGLVAIVAGWMTTGLAKRHRRSVGTPA